MVSALFFLCRYCLGLNWAHQTDARVDFDKLLVQRLEFAELSNLPLRFPHRSLIGKGLCDGLAVDLERQPQVGTMELVFGQMTTTIRFAAASGGGGNGSATQVSQVRDLADEIRSSPLQGFQRFKCGQASLLILA